MKSINPTELHALLLDLRRGKVEKLGVVIIRAR
jgi:hypothetical protein